MTDVETQTWRPIIAPLSVMTSVQVVGTLAILTVPIATPEMARDLGFDADRVGFYTSLTFAGATLITLMAGSLIQRYGPLRLCQIGMLIAVFGLLLTQSGVIPLIFISALFVGCAYGPSNPAGSEVLAKVSPPKWRSLVFSLKQAGVPLGGMLIGLILPALILSVGWRLALLLMAGTLILFAFFLQIWRERFDIDRQPMVPIQLNALWSSVAVVWCDQTLRNLALSCLLFSAIQLCLFSFLVVYLIEVGGLDLISAGFAFSAMQGIGIGARVGWGWIADRYISGRLVLISIALMSAGFLCLLLFIQPFWPFALVLVISIGLGATSAAWNGVALAEVARLKPDQVAAATSGTVVFFYMGIVGGPTAFSILVAVFESYVPAIGLLIAMSLIAGFAFYISGKRTRTA